jgi:hypothetical protein
MLIDACDPDCIPVPSIHLHAEPDSSALFHGGYASNPLLQFYYPPVDSVMTSWAIKNNCNPIIDTTLLANGTKIFRWNSCQNNTYQEIWLADDGGHKWPGTPGTGALSGDSATQDFYATEVAWNFLRQFSKDCSTEVGLGQVLYFDQSTILSPNPSDGVINLIIEQGIDEFEIQIYNLVGEQVFSIKNSKTIHVHDLSAGQYFLRISRNGKIETHKVIKME